MLQKVVIDCDPGIDDSFALMLAIPHLDVIGITAVGGNTQLKYTEKNARYLAQITGRMDIPVCAGYSGPMCTKLETAAEVHGSGGLGTLVIPEPEKQLEEKHAVDFMIDVFLNQDNVKLIALGPLTNVAQAILKEPRLRTRIPEILLMGGSMTAGNHSPFGEFNIWVDPEAAKIVFESGIPIKMVGLNLTRQCAVEKQDEERLREINNPQSLFAADLLDFSLSRFKDSSFKRTQLCDACTVAWYIDPSIIKSMPMHVVVETKGEYTRGMTVCDCRPLMGLDPLIDLTHEESCWHNEVAEPNVEVAVEFDLPKFRELMYSTFDNYSN